eukprot:1388246-Amphidinium_carterae.1
MEGYASDCVLEICDQLAGFGFCRWEWACSSCLSANVLAVPAICHAASSIVALPSNRPSGLSADLLRAKAGDCAVQHLPLEVVDVDLHDT